MNIAMRTLIGTLLIAVVASFGLNACNTTAGIGKDVEAAGDAIHEEAEEHKDY